MEPIFPVTFHLYSLKNTSINLMCKCCLKFALHMTTKLLFKKIGNKSFMNTAEIPSYFQSKDGIFANTSDKTSDRESFHFIKPLLVKNVPLKVSFYDHND